MKYSMVKKKDKKCSGNSGKVWEEWRDKSCKNITDSARMMLTSLTRALGKDRALTSILHQTFPYIRAKYIFSV